MKNIIFDVDGTLWDTTEVVAKAWQRAVNTVGGTEAVITAEVLKKEFGKTMDMIAQNLFADATEAQQLQMMDLCCEYEHEDLEVYEGNLLYPEVKETIEALSKHYNLYIVSNCQSGYIELFMKKNNLESFISDIECFGNTGRPKGENIKLIIERNQLTDVVYVGDTQGDYEATRLAGVPFVFAQYGFGSVEGHEYAISSVSELLNPHFFK